MRISLIAAVNSESFGAGVESATLVTLTSATLVILASDDTLAATGSLLMILLNFSDTREMFPILDTLKSFITIDAGEGGLPAS